MQIICWGSRGSIPVSGSNYLKYGGDTTCIQIVAASGEQIIVDAGTGIRRLGNQMVRDRQTAFHFIFTHSHWDHLMGFPFFSPLYVPDAVIHIYRCPFPGKFIEVIVNKLMGPPHFPVRYSDLKARIAYREGCLSPFRIGSVSVTPVSLSHPNSGCGYKFEEGDKSFVFITDNELGYIHPGGLRFKDYLRFCAGADLLIHDAEYTAGEYAASIEWGHSSCDDAVKLAIGADVGQLGLFHLNRDRTDAMMDQMVAHCRRIIEQHPSRLECFGVAADMTFTL